MGASTEAKGNPTQTPWPELLLLGLKTNKKNRENRSLVIPCSNVQAKACFEHAGLFTVTLTDGPYAYGECEGAFSPNEGAYSQGTASVC